MTGPCRIGAGDQYSMVCGCISHNGFLTRAGYRALDRADGLLEVDSTGSVSGLTRHDITMIFDDGVIDEQHRRFLELEEVF